MREVFQRQRTELLHVLLRLEKGTSVETASSSTPQAPSPWFQADSQGKGVSGGEREEEGPVKIERRNNSGESGPQFCR